MASARATRRLRITMAIVRATRTVAVLTSLRNARTAICPRTVTIIAVLRRRALIIRPRLAPTVRRRRARTRNRGRIQRLGRILLPLGATRHRLALIPHRAKVTVVAAAAAVAAAVVAAAEVRGAGVPPRIRGTKFISPFEWDIS